MLPLKDYICSIQILDCCTIRDFYLVSFGLEQKLTSIGVLEVYKLS